MPKFRQTPEILRLMEKKERIRNICVVAHIDHGKTTMTDSLLVEAGLLSPRIAGPARVLDYLEEEQKRGITIKTANISLIHKMNGNSWVINVVDTPGHVDFTGKVARALRATDGAIVVVDAVEEIMAQTETVTRQALEERVKPILLINKVDRLIDELKLAESEIQRKFTTIIDEFNSLVEIYAERELKEKWKVRPEKGNVVFGSALHKWGFTLGMMRHRRARFSHILDFYENHKYENLAKAMPLHNIILDTVVNELPDPFEAQKYRIPAFWRGNLNSGIGKAMLDCDPDGPTTMCITNVQTDPSLGAIATGRLFSGSLKKGDSIYLVGADKTYKVDEVFMYMGAFREVAGRIPAGNIAAFSDPRLATPGETLVESATSGQMIPFGKVRYFSEPVMTVAVEPRDPKDLPHLLDGLHRLAAEDPNLSIIVSEETGEYLLSGIGELHLEIATTLLRQYAGGVDLVPSTPAVAYREAISEEGTIVVSKSPNKVNSFWIKAEPLKDSIVRLIERSATTGEARPGVLEALAKELELPAKDIGEVLALDEHRNLLLTHAKDLDKDSNVRKCVISGFHWACRTGPLCEEPLRGIRATITNYQVGENPDQREPTQIMRAVSRGILGSCLTARPALLEPIYRVEVSVPPRFIGVCSNIIAHRRGKVHGVDHKPALVRISGHIPAAETFGLSAEMQSATSGHAFWQLTFDHWQHVPKNVEHGLIIKLRKKRGLRPEIPQLNMFIDEN